MCIDDDEKTVEHHAKVFTVFGNSMLEKLTPGVKLTVTCHENTGSYMFCKNWQLHVTFWQKLHKPPVGQLHVRFFLSNSHILIAVVNQRSRTMTMLTFTPYKDRYKWILDWCSREQAVASIMLAKITCWYRTSIFLPNDAVLEYLILT